MSMENVKQFLELVKTDEGLARKVVELKDSLQKSANLGSEVEILAKKVLPLAKAHGLEFTVDEFLAYANSVSGELSDDDLLNVSGGISARGVALGLLFATGLSFVPTIVSSFATGGDSPMPSAPETAISQSYDLNDSHVEEGEATVNVDAETQVSSELQSANEKVKRLQNELSRKKRGKRNVSKGYIKTLQELEKAKANVERLEKIETEQNKKTFADKMKELLESKRNQNDAVVGQVDNKLEEKHEETQNEIEENVENKEDELKEKKEEVVEEKKEEENKENELVEEKKEEVVEEKKEEKKEEVSEEDVVEEKKEEVVGENDETEKVVENAEHEEEEEEEEEEEKEKEDVIEAVEEKKDVVEEKNENVVEEKKEVVEEKKEEVNESKEEQQELPEEAKQYNAKLKDLKKRANKIDNSLYDLDSDKNLDTLNAKYNAINRALEQEKPDLKQIENDITALENLIANEKSGKSQIDLSQVEFAGEARSWDGTIENLYNCLTAADFDTDRIENLDDWQESCEKALKKMTVYKDTLQIYQWAGTSCGSNVTDYKHKAMLKTLATFAMEREGKVEKGTAKTVADPSAAKAEDVQLKDSNGLKEFVEGKK